MKKILSLIFFMVSFFIMAHSQSFPRVKLYFYLDATQSMETNGLWESSKEKLILAIEAIEDKRTELCICVFSDYEEGNSRPASLTSYRFEQASAFADDAGRNKLISFVKSLKSPSASVHSLGFRQTLTNLERPWNHFITESKKNSGKDCISAMILITDGGHEEKYFPNSNFIEHVKAWNTETDDMCYGWVVELKDNVGPTEKKAKRDMDDAIDDQKNNGHLRRVNKHDFNFKFLSISSPTDSINLNETNTFNLKVSANTKDALRYIDYIKFRTNSHLSVQNSKYNENEIQLQIRGYDLSSDSAEQSLQIFCSMEESVETENLVFLIEPKQFELICLNTLSRALNIYSVSEKDVVEIKKDNRKTIGEIEYYEPCSWLASEEKMIPASVHLRFKLNEDAIKENSSALLVFTDENGNLFDRNKIQILDNGKYSDSIVINKPIVDKELSFEFKSDIYDKDKIVGHLNLVDNKSLDSVNGVNVKGQENCVLFEWQIIVDRHWNPAFVKFLWFLFLLLLLFILYLLLLLMRRVLALKFPSNCRFFFEAEGDGENLDMYSFTYKEKPIVYPAHNHGMSSTIQTQWLHRYFIKDIYIVNSNKKPTITKRSFFDRMWNGETLVIIGSFDNKPIDHMVFKPTGSLINVDVEVDVVFNDGTNQIICLPVHLIPKTILQTDLYSINGSMVGIRGAQIHKK